MTHHACQRVEIGFLVFKELYRVWPARPVSKAGYNEDPISFNKHFNPENAIFTF